MKKSLPNLIIAGVHKAATTSLFTYLQAHPEIFAPGKKELHYFTPIRYGKEPGSIYDYSSNFLMVGKEKYLLDASPSYVYGGQKIITKMKELLPPHKVIIILRNPVDRFISYYNFLKAKLYLTDDDNLDSFLNKCINHDSALVIDNEYSRAIAEGKYINYLPTWKENYGMELKIIYFEKMISDPESVMLEIATWLGIDKEPFKKMHFTAENKTVFVKNKQIHSFALLINKRFEVFWRNNHKLKTKFRNIYYAFNRNKKQKKQMDAESLKKLNFIYEPYNSRLAFYLKKENMDIPSWLQ
jgi:Sulfotransferase domain